MDYLSRVDCARAIMRVSALGLLVFSTGCASMMVSRREPERSEIKARVDLTAISATAEGGRFSAELKLTETSRSSNSGKKPLPSEVYLTSQDPRIQELIDEGWVDTPKALRGVDLSKPNPLAPETYDPSEIMRLKRQDMPAFIRLQRQLRLQEFAQAPVSITWSAKDDVWVLTARKDWRHYHTSSSLERVDGEWQHVPFGLWAPPLTRQLATKWQLAEELPPGSSEHLGVEFDDVPATIRDRTGPRIAFEGQQAVLHVLAAVWDVATLPVQIPMYGLYVLTVSSLH